MARYISNDYIRLWGWDSPREGNIKSNKEFSGISAPIPENLM